MIRDGARVALDMYGSDIGPREHLVRCYPMLADVVPPLDHVVATATPLAARVNHGLWITSCDCGAPRSTIPTPGGLVWLETPLVWCLRCQNGATGRGWRPVLAPPARVREQIELVLSLRPRFEDRNWQPPETVADLVAQNLEHGDPVPADDEPGGPALGPDWRRFAAPFSPLPAVANRAGRRLLNRLTRRR